VRDANFRSVQQNRHTRGRLIACLAAVGVVAGVGAACVELQGSLGSDCLKNQDCQSGVCSQLHCAEKPPLFEFEAGPDAGPDAADAASSPATDGTAATMDAPATNDAPVLGGDANVGVPDGSPVPADAGADAVEEAPGPDAPEDAPADAAAARLDAGEAG
jgi:hypothetical protein